MENKLKTAFNKIRAEETLKKNTKLFLQKTPNRIAFRRLTATAASLSVLLISSAFMFNFYFTPSAYVDVDVNPSVEIVLNRFDRVIDTCAYNPDGEKILEDINIKHQKYGAAIGILVDAMAENNFTQAGGLISVTLQSDEGEKENVMLSNIKSAVLEHHGTARLEAFTVGSHVRDAAHDLNLSAAKYLAIQELIDVDPAATIDGCRNHSIGEIKRLTEQHAANHHSVIPPGERGRHGNMHH